MFGNDLTYTDLSDEQKNAIDTARSGRHVRVDATVGSGKTSCINVFCELVVMEESAEVLYLTYSQMLKEEAKRKVLVLDDKYVTNYHSFARRLLVDAEYDVSGGPSAYIRDVVKYWDICSQNIPAFKYIVIDEYQDLNDDTFQLIACLKETNPAATFFFVGDPDQKINNATILDAPSAISHLFPDIVDLSFTQSFRIGQPLADMLSQIWYKPIVGTNENQTIEFMTLAEARDDILKLENAEDLLVIAPFRNSYSELLNYVEDKDREKFNKFTVWANISDGGTRGNPDLSRGPVGVMTPFDSAKGMERDTVYVLGFTPGALDYRLHAHGNTNQLIIKNMFGVAASRAKNRLVFVWDGRYKDKNLPLSVGEEGYLGYVPIEMLSDIKDPNIARPDYKKTVFQAAKAFEYKYQEHITKTLRCIDIEHVSPVLTPHTYRTMDGQMETSSAIGYYTTGAYFENNDLLRLARHAISVYQNHKPYLYKHFEDYLLSSNNAREDADWRAAKTIVAAETGQKRYARPSKYKISRRLVETAWTYLSEFFETGDETEIMYKTTLRWADKEGNVQPLNLQGIVDVRDTEGRLWELKCTRDLNDSHKLQAALYCFMSGEEYVNLLNIATGEHVKISIPDREAFALAVAQTITFGDAASVEIP